MEEGSLRVAFSSINENERPLVSMIKGPFSQSLFFLRKYHAMTSLRHSQEYLVILLNIQNYIAFNGNLC